MVDETSNEKADVDYISLLFTVKSPPVRYNKCHINALPKTEDNKHVAVFLHKSRVVCTANLTSYSDKAKVTTISDPNCRG